MKRKNIFIVTALIFTIFVHGMQIGESSLPFENNDITVGKLMAGMVILFVYFIPTIICWKKKNSKYLLILNIFTAWTILGWFICFIWAFNINRQHARIVAETKRKMKEEKKKIKEAKKVEKLKVDNTNL
ncbi:superinfection immunity protein [Flavobacterium sp. UBA7680]|uniref:superinfection immunity protein n=1 Tax=Flavobacterium sp. UBA7680 TaxID=1946559 RepID=UPI0025C3BE4C|nr:superinfection immunity protein [Flavobacterium sp. UBA7680]